jgi:uncharacterized protein Yka (UPF0111/DUF47 family)
MAISLHRSYDRRLLDLLDEAGRNVERGAALLRDLLSSYPDHPELARDILICEQEGDRIAHDIIHRLHACPEKRVPFGVADGHALAKAIDDIVDYAEQTSDTLALYGIEAPMEQAVELAEILVRSAEAVARALSALGRGVDLSEHLVEIHRLENDGDRLSRDGVAALFHHGIDPMVVIRWKDLFASLEAGVDACEHVAHVLEGITLQQRHR